MHGDGVGIGIVILHTLRGLFTRALSWSFSFCPFTFDAETIAPETRTGRITLRRSCTSCLVTCQPMTGYIGKTIGERDL